MYTRRVDAVCGHFVFRLDLLRADFAADASSSLYSVMEEDFTSACSRTLDSVSINRSSTVDASRLIVVADAVRSSDSRRWYHAMLTNRLYHRRRSDVDGRGSRLGRLRPRQTGHDGRGSKLDRLRLQRTGHDGRGNKLGRLRPRQTGHDGRGSKYGVVEMTPPDTPRHRLDDVDLDTISTDASWTN